MVDYNRILKLLIEINDASLASKERYGDCIPRLFIKEPKMNQTKVTPDYGNGCFWIYIRGMQYLLFKDDIEKLKIQLDQALHYYNEIDELCKNHDEAMENDRQNPEH